MGLIKAAFGAAGGVMADQWKEFFYCEALPADVLAVKGKKLFPRMYWPSRERRRSRAAPATPREMTTSSPTAPSSR